MTKLQKLVEWLDAEIAESEKLSARLIGYSSIRALAYRDVKGKLAEFDTEEYQASLTAAGY